MGPFFLIVLVLVFHPWGQVDFVERPMGTGRFFHLRGQVGWSLQKAHSATTGRFTSRRTDDPSIRRFCLRVYRDRSILCSIHRGRSIRNPTTRSCENANCSPRCERSTRNRSIRCAVCWTAWVNQTLRDGAETLLISAEDLFDMHSAHELDFSAESERNALVSVRAILHQAHGRRWERRNGPQRWTEWEKAQRQRTKSLLS